jgi:hypothetical protein
MGRGSRILDGSISIGDITLSLNTSGNTGSSKFSIDDNSLFRMARDGVYLSQRELIQLAQFLMEHIKVISD